jgi:hypothetical protein
MKITFDTSVAAMLTERPDLRWTLVDGGIVPLVNEHHFPPPQRTVGEAAVRHGIDPQPLIEALNRAAAAAPDPVLAAAIKKKYADFQGGCCGGHAH